MGIKTKHCGVTKIARFIPADGLEDDLIKEMTLELGIEE